MNQNSPYIPNPYQNLKNLPNFQQNVPISNPFMTVLPLPYSIQTPILNASPQTSIHNFSQLQPPSHLFTPTPPLSFPMGTPSYNTMPYPSSYPNPIQQSNYNFMQYPPNSNSLSLIHHPTPPTQLVTSTNIESPLLTSYPPNSHSLIHPTPLNQPVASTNIESTSPIPTSNPSNLNQPKTTSPSPLSPSYPSSSNPPASLQSTSNSSILTSLPMQLSSPSITSTSPPSTLKKSSSPPSSLPPPPLPSSSRPEPSHQFSSLPTVISSHRSDDFKHNSRSPLPDNLPSWFTLYPLTYQQASCQSPFQVSLKPIDIKERHVPIIPVITQTTNYSEPLSAHETIMNDYSYKKQLVFLVSSHVKKLLYRYNEVRVGDGYNKNLFKNVCKSTTKHLINYIQEKTEANSIDEVKNFLEIKEQKVHNFIKNSLYHYSGKSGKDR